MKGYSRNFKEESNGYRGVWESSNRVSWRIYLCNYWAFEYLFLRTHQYTDFNSAVKSPVFGLTHVALHPLYLSLWKPKTKAKIKVSGRGRGRGPEWGKHRTHCLPSMKVPQVTGWVWPRMRRKCRKKLDFDMRMKF